MNAIGRENMSAKRSEKVSASVFGASSPTTMVTSAMRSVVRMKAIVGAASWIAPTGMSAMSEAMAPENDTAPTADARKPKKVRATWIVARNRDGSSRSRSAARAA